MRVFTYALVASSALLAHADSESAAADPSTARHQDPAIAPMTAHHNGAPASSSLRSQDLTEDETVGAGEARGWLSAAAAAFELKHLQAGLSVGAMESTAMETMLQQMRTFDTIPICEFNQADECRAALALMNVYKNGSPHDKKLAERHLFGMIFQWETRGLTLAELKNEVLEAGHIAGTHEDTVKHYMVFALLKLYSEVIESGEPAIGFYQNVLKDYGNPEEFYWRLRN
uniref:Uncharacterized protein n=1 Tax=Peronospora matthiolae TaxID=2874970 RepID=A0AAV1VMC0_9STRA